MPCAQATEPEGIRAEFLEAGRGPGRSQRGKREEILEGWRGVGREARTVSDPEKSTHVFLEGGGMCCLGQGAGQGPRSPWAKGPKSRQAGNYLWRCLKNKQTNKTKLKTKTGREKFNSQNHHNK